MSDAFMLAVSLVALPLAAYRATRFVILDHIAAPYVDRLRVWLEERWLIKRFLPGTLEDTRARRSEQWNSKLAYGLSCAWCLGFWVSGVGSLLVSVAYGLDYLMFALLWLATSTIVGLIGRLDSD